MSLTIFLGVLTLAPALFALAVAAVGAARRALPGAVMGLAGAGLLIPAICLLLLAPDLSSGVPINVALFGGIAGSTASFSAGYRMDSFALYAAFGLAFIVAPVLVWMAFQLDAPAISQQSAAVADDDATPTVVDVEEISDGDGGEGENVDNQGSASSVADAALPASLLPGRRRLSAPRWGGVALALGAETAALTLLFSDNFLWLGLSWLVLSVLVWALGEVGSDFATIDRVGLAVAILAPILWVVAMLLGAAPAKTVSLSDLMGRSVYSPAQIVFLGLALALAGGAYPFTVWIRRRASLITPAGIAALLLMGLPVVLFVSTRSYMAAQDSAGLWPQIGRATPPITAGIVFTLLGALTVAINGLLALRFRDARTILALLAVAQVGWGLLALGMGDPLSVATMVALLATSVLGLGAMLASVYAAGVVTSDIEPDAAGPRPFGSPLRPLGLAAWCIGAVSLVGAPLFGGFVSRHIASAAALRAGGLIIPLTGLAWAGDALLTIALLRVTAPAFALEGAPADAIASPIGDTDDAIGAESRVETPASETPDDAADLEAVDVEGEEEPYVRFSARRSPFSRQAVRELPGIVLALLALAVGVAPQLLFSLGGSLAASTLVPPGAVDVLLTLKTLGYEAGISQWLPVLGWLGALAFVVLLVVLLPGGARVVKPMLHAMPASTDGALPLTQTVSLAEPEDAWSDLRAAFASGLTQPGARWLLGGIDGDVTGETGDEAGADELDNEETGEGEEIPTTESEAQSSSSAATDEADEDETTSSGEQPEAPAHTRTRRKTNSARGHAAGNGSGGIE